MEASSRRVCLVTGSATGIGAACAQVFARQGWSVGLSFFDDATQHEASAVVLACEALGSDTLLQRLNVADDASCKAFATAALERWGRIDALVNCAGTTRFIDHADLDALDASEFRRTYEVHVIGIHQMVRACTDALKASGRGAVVNVSSIGGILGRGSSMAYAASKGAANTLTVALARALAPHIRVNAIAPGFVTGGLPSRVLSGERHAEVEAAQTASSVLQRVSQPEEVAALAHFLVEHAPGMTGEVLMLDNGLHLNA